MLNIATNPSAGIKRAIFGGTTEVSIDVVVEETDDSLPFQFVGAEIDWNDGAQPVSYPGLNAEQKSPLLLMGLRRNLGLGVYAVTITAHNNRSPQPDVVKALVPITISPSNAKAPPARYLFGPILPRDDGAPSAQTWMFDLGNDLLILASNLKMLLLTTVGERIMQPTYGTNLRRIIFELNVASVQAIIQQEVAQAIAKFEPRVTLASLEVQRQASDPRSVNLAATFLSKQNGQLFAVNLPLTQ